MVAYNDTTDRHFQRLTEVVKHSHTQTRKYRELNQMLIDAAMGQYYPRFFGREPDTPINLLWMTHRAMSRWLYMRDPRVLATTSVPQWQSFAEDAEIALNRTIKEADFGSIISRVVDQSLYSVGALFMSADYVGTEYGMKQKIVLENVPFPDLVWDAATERIDDSDYLGRRMFMKRIDVREHPLFDEEQRQRVEVFNADFRPDEDKANWQREGGGYRGTDLYDYVQLLQVWDRADNRLYVWPADQPDVKLMAMPWNGPRHGPIRILHYGTPPGHPYPVSPMQNVYRLARASNVLLTKALRQQQTAKGLLSYTSAQQDEAKSVVDSPDLNSVLQEHGALRWSHVGGASPDTVAMSELARKLFSYAVGNLDQLLGLGSQAPTLGQERMLSDATTASMEDMGGVVYKFVKGAVEDAYWFNIRDPKSETELTKPLGRTGLSYDVSWTPEKRRFIEQMNFQVDVEPYSYRSRTPDGRLADFLGALQLLERWTPQMAAQGMMFDMEGIVRTIAKFKDIPELYDGMILNQDPEQLAKLLGPRSGQAPMDAAPGSTTRHIRESRGDGSGEAQELLRMFGQGQQDYLVGAA